MAIGLFAKLVSLRACSSTTTCLLSTEYCKLGIFHEDFFSPIVIYIQQ